MNDGDADRHHQRHARRARHVRRPAGPAAADLRRPGRDRDRERAAVQRDAGGAGAADRDRRHPEGDRQFAVRRAAGVRGHRGERATGCRSGFRLPYTALRRRRRILPRSRRNDGRPPSASLRAISSDRSTAGSGASIWRAAGRRRTCQSMTDDGATEPDPARAIAISRGARFPQRADRAAARDGEVDRRHHVYAQRGQAVRRAPDRAAADLRRPGRDRDRERAAVQRGAGRTRD